MVLSRFGQLDRGRWPRPTPSRRHGIGGVCLVVGALIGLVPTFVSQTRGEPSVDIVSPQDGAVDQPYEVYVSGTYSGLSQGQTIWVANRTVANPGRYYVQLDPCAKRDDGTFQCPLMHVGRAGSDNGRYQVLALIADGSVKSEGLRASAMVADVVTITRK